MYVYIYIYLSETLDRREPASGSPGRAPEAGARCLELGAGHGLPGLVALRHGYRVDFHDLSARTALREVLVLGSQAHGHFTTLV